MRARAIFALALLLAVPVSLAQPAAPPAGDLLSDAESDVRVETQAGPQDAPDQASVHLDLRSLTIQEEVDAFTFTVKMQDLKADAESTSEDGTLVDIQFVHEGRTFRILAFHQLPAVQGFLGAALLYRDGDSGDWNQLWWREGGAVRDVAADTYSVAVGRNDLADAMGASPYPERVFADLRVQSMNLASQFDFNFMGNSQQAPVRIMDDMPDAGGQAATYPVQLGLVQQGDARLASDEPFRASNGEATTFLYQARGINVGETAGRFDLRATSVPAGWSVVLPVPTLEIEPDASVDFPVMVTMPFSHTHGKSESFVLEMVKTGDPTSVGRLAMGVQFLTIPQPAGHHNMLYFHSRSYDAFGDAFGTVFTGNDGIAFMNTVESMDGDAGLALTPQGSSWNMQGDQPQAEYSWCIALDPALQMGLDFDRSGKGHLRVPIQTTAPLNGATLYATLQVVPADTGRFGCFRNESTVLGYLNGTTPVDIGASSQGILEGDLDIMPEADVIPYAKGQNLFLYVEVRGVGAPNFFAAPATPRLMPGGQLELPLLEYHDDVEGVLTTLTETSITPLGPQDRLANPGATILFPLSVANQGDNAVIVAFNATGQNSAWATLPAGGAIEVPAHGTARADIVVKVPMTAKQGDVADIVVQAYDQANRTGRGLVRLLVTVETGQTLPDDSALMPQADPVKESPAWAPLSVVVALVAIAALLRRKA